MPHVNVSTAVNLTELQFLALAHRDREYFALVDSGAQINLLSANLLHNFNYKLMESEQPRRLRGVNDSSINIELWVKINFHLENGEPVTIPFAVVQGIKTSIL